MPGFNRVKYVIPAQGLALAQAGAGIQVNDAIHLGRPLTVSAISLFHSARATISADAGKAAQACRQPKGKGRTVREREKTALR